ncbi:structural maintenance of chromosomes protein 6A-like [Primulina huaijiensis]|uniref:structural maintenance of chromosomes protein 6A-like n=1 Tax=Primulina huaijiensis TaxID=1492673 RepID=UPI003CC77C1A
MERTSEARRMKEDLQQSLSMALKEKLELEGERERRTNDIQKMVQQVKVLEQQIHDFHEQHVRSTQVEENEMEERLRSLQVKLDEVNVNWERLKEEEDAIIQMLTMIENDVEKISNQIEDAERSHQEVSSRIRELQMHQTNKVTAFGGGRVSNLLQAVERHHQRFSNPPIGPIGVHVVMHGRKNCMLHPI